ncbi:MAG: phage holin family protein [Chloroflexi bacterium]|nr:phage holin family protein [Chloroflexota bacterium]
MRILVRLLINAVALWLTSWLLPGITLSQDVLQILIVAAIYGLVNTFIRPIVKLLTLPINIVTLGLFTLVINAFMLLLTTIFTDALTVEGGLIGGFVNAFIAAIVISVISTVLSWVLE